jgi:glycogen debranching enzyme
MLPNRFPDAGETPEYNTVDATLWFFEAARAYVAYTGDVEFVRNELYPVFADIIAWHVRGTRYGIKVDSSGLLLLANPGPTHLDGRQSRRLGSDAAPRQARGN